MELDDLKEKWKSSIIATPTTVGEALEHVSALQSSGRGIRRMFVIEMGFIVAIYLGFVSIVWVMGDLVMSYIYKLVVVTTIGSIPVTYRLHKVQKWANSMDYTQDIRSNVLSFLTYYKNTLRIYKWSTYLIFAAITLIMFNDNEFLQLSTTLKIVIIAYMGILMLLAAPYVRYAYGKRTAVFEHFLQS